MTKSRALTWSAQVMATSLRVSRAMSSGVKAPEPGHDADRKLGGIDVSPATIDQRRPDTLDEVGLWTSWEQLHGTELGASS